MSDAAPQQSSARCVTHPEHEAEGTCARCGGFLCARCSSPGIDDQQMCDPCVERGVYGASTRSKVALGLSVITFAGVLPGLVALSLARAELRDIAQGKRLPEGAMFARLARSIAWIELGVLLAAVMAWGSQWLG